MNKTTPPIILVYIYNKIRERIKGNIISTKYLKEILNRSIISSKGGDGGDKRGIPRVYIYDVIKDLEKFSLIKKIDYSKYEINTKYEVENPILQLNHLLKRLNTSDEFRGKINNIIEDFLEKVSFDGNYKIEHLDKKNVIKKFPY